MDIAELVIREGVRDTYATYTHAGDRFRLDELAACFAVDGVLEVKGRNTAVGRPAIVAMLGGSGARSEQDTEPALMRHFVTNLLFESITPERVESTAYFCVVTRAGEHLGVDHWGRYRDVLVPDGDRWVFAHRVARLDVAVPGGWLAGA
jgi:SnoaL-like domain